MSLDLEIQLGVVMTSTSEPYFRPRTITFQSHALPSKIMNSWHVN